MPDPGDVYEDMTTPDDRHNFLVIDAKWLDSSTPGYILFRITEENVKHIRCPPEIFHGYVQDDGLKKVSEDRMQEFYDYSVEEL